MNIWENAIVTDSGRALLSKLIEGNNLVITRAETGEGYVSPSVLSTQTAVLYPKQALTFSAVSYPEEGKCKLVCKLTNDSLSGGYTAKQVGVYATDPDKGEILFMIVQASSGEGTIIPSAAEMKAYSAEWTLYFQFGQASGVTVTVDPSNAVSRGDMEAYVAEALKEVEIPVDSELDLNSENPVQNKIVAESINVIAQDTSWLRTQIGLNAREIAALKENEIPTIAETAIGTTPGIDDTTDYGIYKVDGNSGEKYFLFVPENSGFSFVNQVKITPSGEIYTRHGTWYDKTDETGAVVIGSYVGWNEWLPYGGFVYSPTDLEAGTSKLESGKMYLVYE